MKVTLEVAQTVPLGSAEMLTEGVTDGVTVIVIVLLVAVVELKQDPPATVTTQLTRALLAKDALVYVDEFVPTLAPFSFHW